MAKGKKKKEALQLLRNLQSLRVHVHTDASSFGAPVCMSRSSKRGEGNKRDEKGRERLDRQTCPMRSSKIFM